MPSFRIALTTAALAFSTPALADVTADDVWDSWQGFFDGIGESLRAGSTERQNGTLVLRDVMAVTAFDDGGATTSIDEVVLQELGDGSVDITASPTYRIVVEAAGSDGEEIEMTMVVTQDGLQMTASGDPEAIDYAYVTDSVELVLESFVTDGPEIDLDFALALEQITGSYATTEEEVGTTLTSDFTADALAVSMKFNDPEEEVTGDIALTMAGLSSTSGGQIAPFSSGENLANLLRQGLTSDGQFVYGATAYRLDISEPDGDYTIDGSAEGGLLEVDLSEEGLRYASSTTGTAVSIVAPGAMMPPIAFQIAASSGELQLPLLSSDGPRPFALVTRLLEVEVSDAIWSMIDPTGGLPRDPANLTIDLSGTGRWSIDVADPVQMAEIEESGELPGELETVDVNALELSLAGAALTGTGAFTFDNSSTPPVPAGVIDLTIVGANALIDRLISIGLLPEDQAMAARMMLGLFARPGDGEDTLVSTIELKEDGAVLANGQRIR